MWGESPFEKADRVKEEDEKGKNEKKNCSSFMCSNMTSGSDSKCPECLKKDAIGKDWV